MASPRAPIAPQCVQHLGFSWSRGQSSDFVTHRHVEIELFVLEGGPIRWSYAGRDYTIRHGWLAVLWGIHLHGTRRLRIKARAHVLRIPLSWVLQWQLPAWFIQRLLGKELLVDRSGSHIGLNLQRIRRWETFMTQGSPEARRIVLLEVQARLHEFALELGKDRTAVGTDLTHGVVSRFERMATFIAERFQQPLRVADIAAAVSLHRVSAMRLFRKVTGMTIHEYLTQHRLSYAQQLLSTTDLKIVEVARRCGFHSIPRLYGAFEKHMGVTPGEYRRRWSAA